MNTLVNQDLMVNLFAILPELLLTVLACFVILLDAFNPRLRRNTLGVVSAVGMFAIAVVAFLLPVPEEASQQLVLGGMIRYDTMKTFFVIVTLVAAGISSLISIDAPGVGRQGEFYGVIIAATVGACLISGAADMIMAFLGLETLSISLYILAGYLRRDARSAEAGMKYFLFGAFTSAIMLYGMSLLYGFTQQTNIYAIGKVLQTLPFQAADGVINVNVTLPILMAMLMIVVGFGFKVSAVPFHFWTPDVYEGAPTPVTAYISVASKAASFALLMRFFIVVFQGNEPTRFWVQMIAVMALVTMSFGNLLALVQRNIKRLLAYSSIAQAGYTLVGVAAIAQTPGAEAGQGAAAVGFYMAMYVLTNLAAFGVIILFANATGSETIADFAGLSRRHLGLALALTVALLSLGGIPPAAGFFGKFFLFRAAVNSNLTWLAVVGVINSIVALYYYLVIIKVMFVDRSEDEEKAIPVSAPYAFALLVSCILVILLGALPSYVYEWAQRAASGLFS